MALAAAMVLSPAAFPQQDSVSPPDSSRTLHSPADCAVFITGDFESECILPLGKPDTYLNEEGVSLIACQGGTVTYTAHLVGNASAVAWSWYVSGAVTWTDHGDGSITVHWAGGDTGFLSVDVTDADINICSVEKSVLLMERPVAVVNTVPPYVVDSGRYVVYVCRGESVDFIDESTLQNGDLAGYYWYNDYSHISASSRNFHVSNVMETQTVSHRVYNNCGCYDSIEFEIRIRYGVPLELSCYGTVCAGQEVTYTALSPECDAYAWHVEGGSFVGDHNSSTVTVLWGNPSSGYGTLGIDGVLCDVEACQSLMTKKIPILIDSLAISGQQSACVGESVEYSVPLYGSTEYTWSISPNVGNSMYELRENRIVVTFPQVGTYRISVNYGCTFLGCTNLHSDTLVVSVKPRLALSGDRRVCEGSPCVIHTVPSGTVADWTVRDSIGSILFIGVGDTLPYQFDTLPAGKYRITAENATFCHSADYILTIVAAPPAPLSISNNNPTIACPNSAILLRGEADNPTWSLVWRPVCGDATPHSVSGSEVTITFADTVCDVRVYNYDRISGCLSNNYYTHHVSEFQLAQMSVGHDTTVCPGTELHWAAPFQPDVIYEWQLEREKQYCASMQGDVYSNADSLLVNELTPPHTYPTTFSVMLHRTYCSTLKDTTFISITVDTLPVQVSIDSVPLVCQGDWIELHGSCNGTSSWSVAGSDYYSLHGDSVVFDEPGVFSVSLSCNPYNVCTNQRYLHTVSTTVQVEPLPPFAAIAYTNGFVSTIPPLSDADYSFLWSHDTTDSHIVPAAPGATHYTCVVSSRTAPNCSRTLQADIDTTCLHTDIFCAGFNYCDSNATFSLPYMPSGTQVYWSVVGGEYGDGTAFVTFNPEITLPFARLGDYLVLAAVAGNQCYYGYYVLTVDFIPGLSVEKKCNRIEITNTSRTLTGIGSLTLNCNGSLWSFPVTQRNYLSVPLPDGNYTVSLVAYDGHQLSCPLGNVSIANTGGASLSIANEFDDTLACDNTAIRFVVTATPSNSVTSVLWSWDDGSASTSLNNYLYHTFRDGRNYNVTVTLTDSNGCQSIGYVTVNSSANALKDASIGVPVSLFCPGNAKEITYLANGFNPSVAAEYFWNNLTSFTQSNKDTVYSTGDYRVTAIDSNHCKGKAMANVRFKNKPQALIVTDGHPLCVNDAINFYGAPDPDTEEYDFLWQIRRNNTLLFSSVEPNMTYTPTLAGTYTVSLSVTNNEGCSASALDTFTVSPRPAKPTILWAGNQCIDEPPVNLVGSNYLGELHWSNGHVGDSANYFVAGSATAWFYDSLSGCRSEDESIYITPAPDFDALLTGCYNLCEKTLYGLSPLHVWGLMPSGHNYRWDWMLNGNISTSGSTQINQINLPLTGFGDYRLAVLYNDGHCSDTSLTLSLHDSCICDDVKIDYVIRYSADERCRIRYFIEVIIYNTTSHKICFDDLQLADGETDGISIIGHDFNGQTIAPNGQETYKIELEVMYSDWPTVHFVLHDGCRGCYQSFAIDLSDIQIPCDNQFSSSSVLYRNDISSDSTAYFSLLFGSSFPVQSLIVAWSEPQAVIDHFYAGSNLVNMLAMFDRQELARMAQNHDTVCFYAIVCNKGILCRQHYCLPADTLLQYSLDSLRSSQSPMRFSTGAGRGADNEIQSSGNAALRLQPNPAFGLVRVVGADGIVDAIDVLDMQGRRKVSFHGCDSFDCATLPVGEYIVRVTVRSIDDSVGTPRSAIDVKYLKLIKQ